jgi:hypothetical protein
VTLCDVGREYIRKVIIDNKISRIRERDLSFWSMRTVHRVVLPIPEPL